MTPTYTGIRAELKNYGVNLIAEFPDYNEKIVHLTGEDVREFYNCNPAKWLELYSEDEKMLYEAFELVNGIRLAD